MTFAAVKKLAFKLPRRQRLRLAAELSGPEPILPGSVGIEELERRIDEVESGKVKPISWEEFQRDLDKMRKSIKRDPASAAPRRGRKTPKSKPRHST